MATILGEPNPGFPLWTSAHGFHHISLTISKGWKTFWTILVILLSLSLFGCIIYYFYYVFSSATFTRVIQEAPASILWPTTIICDRQIFSASKINQAQAALTTTHASILTFSVDPILARPDVMNQSRVAQLGVEINNAMSKVGTTTTFGGSYGGGYGTNYGSTFGSSTQNQFVNTPPYGTAMDNLFRAISPNCTQLILQCTFGNTTMNGWDCCNNLFDPNPYFTAYGTCFSTRGARQRNMITQAGDANSFTIITMHDQVTPFDTTFVSPRLVGAQGMAFAVVDDNITVAAAMSRQSQTVIPLNYASVSLTRTIIDNTALEWSAVAPLGCVTPGVRKPYWVDADLLYGIEYRYGYSKEACETTKNLEMAARELLQCTFNPLQGDAMPRCNANQSVAYYRSFIDSNKTATPDIPYLYYVEQKAGLPSRYYKMCKPDCYLDKYSMTSSFFAMSQTQVSTLQTYVQQSGQAIQGANVQTAVLKLSLSSLEYQRMYNFPMPGIQFVAEIGGLMAFFLGMSIISVLECCCYCCCCGCKGGDEEKD